MARVSHSRGAVTASPASGAPRAKKASGPVVLCICAYRCRKTMSDQGKVIPVSTRQTHRKKDTRALAGKVWVTAAQEELVRDSVLRNQYKSFHASDANASPTRSSAGPGGLSLIASSLPVPASGSTPSGPVPPSSSSSTGSSQPSSPHLPPQSPALGHHLEQHLEHTSQASSAVLAADSRLVVPSPAATPLASDALIPSMGQLTLSDEIQVHHNNDNPALLHSRPAVASYTDVLAELTEGDGDEDEVDTEEDQVNEDAGRGGLGLSTEDGLLDDSYLVGLEPVPGSAQKDVACSQYGAIPTGFEGRIGPLTLKEAQKLDRLMDLDRTERAAAAARSASLLPFGRDLLVELLSGRSASGTEAPMSAPAPTPPVEPTPSNILTIDHLTVWEETGGTMEAYERHGELLARRTETPVGSLHVAHGLVQAASELTPVTIDMCPASCMAYTGPRSTLSACAVCGLGRYREQLVAGRRVPVKTYQYLPYKPRLAAYYSTKLWAEALRYGVHKMREAAASFRTHPDGRYECSPAHRFGDVFDGVRSAQLLQDGLFGDERDIAVAISTDGAQLLPHRRSSSAWVVLLQTLSLPPSARFALQHQHISMVVPGPNSPTDLDSFLWPLYAELAELAVYGTRMWDAGTDSWFRLRVHLLSVYADQPAL